MSDFLKKLGNKVMHDLGLLQITISSWLYPKQELKARKPRWSFQEAEGGVQWPLESGPGITARGIAGFRGPSVSPLGSLRIGIEHLSL